MDEQTKAKLKEAGLEAVVTTIGALQKQIAEKDVLIAQKTDDLVKFRNSTKEEFKKLSEMTEAERAAMSEKEIELQKGLEALAERTALFEKQQADTQKKEVDARWDRTATRLAGNNPELKAKILEARTKIVDHDKAQTDEEIATIANSAFNMLGVPKPDPIRTAINGGDGEPGGQVNPGDFANSEAGKDLAAAMNLPVEAAK